MSKPVLKFYYEQIKKAGSESSEPTVSNFWNNTLPLYFTQDNSFGIELEPRLLEGIVKRRTGFTIRCVRNGDLRKAVVFVEDNRIGHEAEASSMWDEAVVELTSYLKVVRMEQNDSTNILYGAVAMGTYIRFYYLIPSEDELRDYQSIFTGKAYELEDDEYEVHKILNEVVAQSTH